MDRSAHEVRATLDALRRIVQALRVSGRDAERRVGLSAAQLFALHQLASMPGASVNDLAARTFTHQSSVSVVVQKLVDRGLVLKLAAPEDRRRARLAITPAGRALLRRSPEPAQERLIAGIAALTAAQRQALTWALTAVARAVSSGTEPPPMFDEERKGGPANAKPGRARRAPSGRAPRG